MTFSWREASFADGCAEVATWRDRLGKPIDPGIFALVVALNMAGIPTSQSCEGHLGWGLPYPWVMIDREVCACYEREYSAWRAAPRFTETEILEAYRLGSTMERAMGRCTHRPGTAIRLLQFIALYTTSLPSLRQAMLTLDFFGATFYRLVPVSALAFESEEERLAALQHEMSCFGVWLRNHLEAKRPN